MPNKRSHYGEFEFGSNSSIQVFGYKQIRLSFWYCHPGWVFGVELALWKIQALIKIKKNKKEKKNS